MTEHLYRLEYNRVSLGVDEYDDPLPGHNISLYMSAFRIIRRTPKGAWIERMFDGQKFILLTATKQWASETEEKAVRQFIRRKTIQKRIVESHLQDIEKAIHIATNYKVTPYERNPIRQGAMLQSGVSLKLK
jgi:hypothetical protein